MIVVDSSVWVDHLRRREAGLAEALEQRQVLAHPFVIGELACGQLRKRPALLGSLAQLPQSPVASHDEALAFLDRHALAGRGIDWLGLHLLAATSLAGDARLWTRDKRLAAVAKELVLDHVE